VAAVPAAVLVLLIGPAWLGLSAIGLALATIAWWAWGGGGG